MRVRLNCKCWQNCEFLKQCNKKRFENPNLKLRSNLSILRFSSFNSQNGMIGVLGCSQKFFERRVDFQLGLYAEFSEGRDLPGKMWFKIAFDHILPCSSFNLLDEKQ